jgi:hypothetical protein
MGRESETHPAIRLSGIQPKGGMRRAFPPYNNFLRQAARDDRRTSWNLEPGTWNHFY